MKKISFSIRKYILSAIILITLLSSFAFTAEVFARNFLLGLSAGTAMVLLGMGFKRSDAKERQSNNTG